MHKLLVIRFYFDYMLCMFQTVLVHLQKQPFVSVMSCLVFGCRVVIGRSPSYNNPAARRTGLYQIRHKDYERLLLKMD